MVRFVVGSGKPEEIPMSVSLEQDGADVNTFVNGELVGWFSGSDGCLHLPISKSTSLEQSGLEFNNKGCIKVR